jgi:O-antigen ligase
VAWQRALEVVVENPLFGIGFNTYGFVQDHRGFERLGTASYSAEGGLLFITVMTGIVGLFVYLTMLTFVLRRCRNGWRHPRATAEERALFVGTAGATIAILIHSVFVNSLLMPFVMELLWVLWGLSFVAARSVGNRAASQFVAMARE